MVIGQVRITAASAADVRTLADRMGVQLFSTVKERSDCVHGYGIAVASGHDTVSVQGPKALTQSADFVSAER